ncbi:MAG: CPBP family intramembrane metalloprotease [Clostridia bacterium]|nr:CPBP family intramembrane metalloprotease [Clostridia bacterium]
MERQQEKNLKSGRILRGLLGETTPAKASGIAFSVATVLPSLFSFVFIIVLTALPLSQEELTQADWYLYVSYLLPQAAFALTTFLYLRYMGISVVDALKQQKCKPKYFLLALLMQIGLLSLSQANTLFLEFLKRFGYKDAGIQLPSMDGFGFVGVLIMVALVPAVFEEVLFRGVLLNGLKKTFSEPTAILLCGAFFALYHQNPAQTVYQFCCGVAFAFVAIRSGSILPTILSHFFNNALILILAKLGVESFSPLYTWVIAGGAAACLIVALLWLLLFDKKGERQEPQGGEVKKFFLTSAVGLGICLLVWIMVLITGM